MNNKLLSMKDMFYWLVILALIILYLMTEKLSADQNVINYVSFAGTIVSIILGLVAIIYAFFQNFSSASAGQMMIEEARRIQDVVSRLDTSSQKTTDESIALVKRFEELSVALDTAVQSRLEGTQEKLDRIENLVAASVPPTPSADQKSLFESEIKVDIPDMLGRTSKYGLIVLYLMVLVYRSGIRVPVQEILKDVFPGNSQYGFGYWVATMSMNIFKYEYADNQYKIVSMPENFELELGRKINPAIFDPVMEPRNTIIEKMRVLKTDLDTNLPS